MIDEHVTPAFHLSEFTASDTAERLAIDNTPGPDVLATLHNVLIPAMQQIRNLLGCPIIIKSGYRCRTLNAAVRGATSSQHLTGNAADFVCPGFGDPRAVCELLVKHLQPLGIDQLIFEGSWVHVSFSARTRREVLTARFTADGVQYLKGLV